ERVEPGRRRARIDRSEGRISTRRPKRDAAQGGLNKATRGCIFLPPPRPRARILPTASPSLSAYFAYLAVNLPSSFPWHPSGKFVSIREIRVSPRFVVTQLSDWRLLLKT